MSQDKIKIKNLLVVRTDRIGDVILSLPVARAVKKHFPDCKITYLVRNYTEDLVLHHPFIDEYIPLIEKDDKLDLNLNIRLLKQKKFDSSIIVNPTFKTSLMIFLSRIPLRIGTGYRWYSWLFNSKVYEHRKDARRHELEYNLGMLKNIGIDEEVTTATVKFDLTPSESALDFINRLFINENISDDKPIIIFHPGSGGSSIDIPLYKFEELIKILLQKFNVRILITGLEQERTICQKLVINDSVINLAGKLSLSQLIALTSKAKLFIANSTGPIHIAAALGIPVIGFYPKILACSSNRWGPYSKNSIVFTPNINCSGCTREQCTRLNCMSSIDVKDVLDSTEKILNLVEKNGE
jgi:lipopolysaccharide heptosyltransferase II